MLKGHPRFFSRLIPLSKFGLHKMGVPTPEEAATPSTPRKVKRPKEAFNAKWVEGTTDRYL